VQPSRGSIQLNFGGPGVPTRETAVAIGPLLQMYVITSSNLSISFPKVYYLDIINRTASSDLMGQWVVTD
jgi:hypothetical protein